jgi:hypothetical protein
MARTWSRSFGRPGDQRQRVIGDLRALEVGDAAQHGDLVLGFDPAQVEALAARQHRDRHLAHLGGGEDELHVRGGFLQRLEQRVEGRGGQHVHLVDDVDFVARRGRPVMYALDDFADVADTGARGRVHLHDIHMAALHDGHAVFALPARVGRRAAPAIRARAVHALGDDPGRGRLAGAADAGHQEGLGDAVGGEGVLERTHHGVLPYEIGKGLGTVFAGKHLVAGLVGHGGLGIRTVIAG